MEMEQQIFSKAKIKLACEIMYAFRQRNAEVTIDFPVENHRLLLRDSEWFDTVQRRFVSGNYIVSNAKFYSAPKGNGLIRHFFNFSLEDQLYYTLLVMDCFPAIYKGIFAKGFVDSDEALKSYPTDSNWSEKIFRQNKSVRNRRIDCLGNDVNFVVHTDITAFCPNIDQNILISELEQFGAQTSTLSRLKEALSIWSILTQKGIPQIFWSTDMLGEFYLSRIDINMRANNYRFVRESDNIEIYCKTFSEARNKLMDLSHLLYNRGLFPNSNKTYILTVAKFRRVIMLEEGSFNKVKGAFKRFFKRLTRFYYLMEERTGINACYDQLIKSPVDTFPVLQHYERYQINIDHSLARFISSNENVYPHQIYIVLKWLRQHNAKVSEELMNSIRSIAFYALTEYYVVSIARELVLKFGSNSDKNFLQEIYSRSSDEWEKSDLGYLLNIK